MDENQINQSFAVTPFSSLYLDVHAIIFETCIGLRAKSSRCKVFISGVPRAGALGSDPNEGAGVMLVNWLIACFWEEPVQKWTWMNAVTHQLPWQVSAEQYYDPGCSSEHYDWKETFNRKRSDRQGQEIRGRIQA